MLREQGFKTTGCHGRLKSRVPWYNLSFQKVHCGYYVQYGLGEVRVLPPGFFCLLQPGRRPITQQAIHLLGCLQEGLPITAPPHPSPFLARPITSKETLKRLPRLTQGQTPKVSRLQHSGQLSVMQPFADYPWDVCSPCRLRMEEVQNSLPGRSGPAQSDQPGGSAAGPSQMRPCGARARPAGMRPGQPSLPCPRLPGKHPPRHLRPSQQ